MVASTRCQIGVAISRDRIRIVQTLGSAVSWAGEAGWTGHGELRGALSSLLEEMPRPRRRPPPLIVAVGPSRCQLRPLAGLPAVDDPRLVARLIEENAATFFLRNGAPLQTARVVRGADLRWWGAAVERPVFDSILSGCIDAEYRVRAIVPSAAAIAVTRGAPQCTWSEDDWSLSIATDSGKLVAVHRIANSPEVVCQVAPTLTQLGERASAFTAAHVAATLDPSTAVPVFVVKGSQAAYRPPPVWRVAVALGTAGLAVIFAFTAPLLAARWTTHVAQASISAFAERAADPLRWEAELGDFRVALQEFADLTRSPIPPPAVVIHRAGQALPPGAALLRIRLDDGGAQLVVVAPRIGRFLDALEADGRSFSQVRVVGPITRERLGGEDQERATIEVRLP